MDTNAILAALDSEILRLQQVKKLLTTNGSPTLRKPGRPAMKAGDSTATFSSPEDSAATPRKRRKLSADGRAKIAAAQRARWAKLKKKSPRQAKRA